MIDPWGSKLIDKYMKVFEDFGIEKITENTKSLINHPFFERNIIVGQRDLNKILEQIKNKKPFINVTGIASSSPLHFGHKVIIDIFNLFKKLGGKNYFAVCDLDAYISRPDTKISSLKKAQEYAMDVIANALALGVDEKEIYLQSKKDNSYFTLSNIFYKKFTENEIKAVLGHLEFGKIAAVTLQMADILHTQLKEYEGPLPTIVPIGLDQDPILRLTRDMVRRTKEQFNFELPSTIYVAHQPSLLNDQQKMSSSIEGSAIFLNDEPKIVNKKIDRAFTGGRDTEKEQRKIGGNPDICKVCTFLRFHYPDSNKVSKIVEDCYSGKILCGETKQILKDFINKFIEEHKEKYEKSLEIAKNIVAK